MMKKLAIVGSGTHTRDQAPWSDKEFDIWVFNEAGNSPWCKRFDAVFQIHPEEIYTGYNSKDAKHWEWLQQSHGGKPIYMQNQDPRVPDCVEYPLEAAKKLCGVRMFPTTFAYMAALAVMQGYEQVRIFGVELSSTEYDYQKDGYLFWFGFLRGRLGTDNVDSAVLYMDKNIFDVALYGYEGNTALGADYFKAQGIKHDGAWKAAEKNTKGVQTVIRREIERKNFERVRELAIDLQNAAMLAGEYAGAQGEAERYAKFGDRFADRNAFELAAATAQREGEIKRTLMLMTSGKAEYVWNVWRMTGNPEAVKQLLGFLEAMADQAYDTGAMLGIYHENMAYLNKYDAAALALGVNKRDSVLV